MDKLPVGGIVFMAARTGTAHELKQLGVDHGNQEATAAAGRAKQSSADVRQHMLCLFQRVQQCSQCFLPLSKPHAEMNCEEPQHCLLS